MIFFSHLRKINLSSSGYFRLHMTGTLQRVIEAGRIAIEAIPYELAWGEIDSADDLMAYQNQNKMEAAK